EQCHFFDEPVRHLQQTRKQNNYGIIRHSPEVCFFAFINVKINKKASLNTEGNSLRGRCK
ncbi:TPA: hypothetical protein ACIJWR_004666, partial [Citrobacter sedlakii]